MHFNLTRDTMQDTSQPSLPLASVDVTFGFWVLTEAILRETRGSYGVIQDATNVESGELVWRCQASDDLRRLGDDTSESYKR